MLINIQDFIEFLRKTAQQGDQISQVVVPVRSEYADDTHTFFRPLTESNTPLFNSYRTVDPAKFLLYLPREQVFPAEQTKNRILAGVKACDLKALELLDAALLYDQFTDPAYKQWRDSTLIITSDCDDISSSCHCNLVNGQPFAENGYDLNLSQIKNDFLITVGSDRGDKLLDRIKSEIKTRKASESQRMQVEKQRKRIIERLTGQNKPYSRSSHYEKLRTIDPAPWQDESMTCIGCGACTHICPTCYCLILNDESKADQFIKQRSFDSCQYNGYARVAGGATPRPSMTERFRNRYLCKFDYMVHNFEKIGCTGCGRCTQACAGEIDFRQVVHNLQNMAIAVQ
ncbi:MAG: 4Fe-4S dicluster domain-containing protein [candidate division KSB1 bacterium]|nr:4Fe-4S dicluster domain-containing protein [candidate division KSB1 bacterium]